MTKSSLSVGRHNLSRPVTSIRGEAAPEALQQINENLKQVGDRLKQQADDYRQRFEKTDQVHNELQQRVDESLKQYGALQQQLLDVEQRLAQGPEPAGQPQPTMLERLQDSEAFQTLASNLRGTAQLRLPRHDITTLDGNNRSLGRTQTLPLVPGPSLPLRMRDLIAPGRTDGGSIEYVRETGFVNNAAPVKELATKPTSELTLENITRSVRTVAHMFHASKQALADITGLASLIDARAGYGLALAEEAQLLWGTNTGEDLDGIGTNASDFSAHAQVAALMTNPIDRLRVAILQVLLAEYPADGIVLNPVDWAVIELTKDGIGRSIVGNAENGAQPKLWNLPVVQSPKQVANTFLVGAFRGGAQIFDREDMSILLSTEHADNFAKNRVSILAEERLAQAIYRPEAFVVGDVLVAGDDDAGSGG